MPERQFTVLGLVNSGKTTYFAALYYLLKNAEDEYAFRIDLGYEIKDRAYLNMISQQWARMEKLGRTATGTWQSLELPLLNRADTSRLVAFVPDMAGEFFHETLKSRSWDISLAGQLDRSNGLMLFINVEDYRSVDALDEKWARARERLSITSTEPENEKVETKLWEADPNKLPSDVTYTDLIQQVYYYDQDRNYRLAILLSAWDQIKKRLTPADRALYDDPEAYFNTRFPLLSQFLQSHQENFEVSVFGVSAYGADPDDQEARKELLNRTTHERVQIVSREGVGHDITLPLVHLLHNDR